MSTTEKYPFYIRCTVILVGAFAFVTILYLLKDIILPLIYSVLFAILISPMVNWLVSKKMNRAAAVSIVVFVFLITLIAPIALLSTQADLFSDALPQLTEKFEKLVNQTVKWGSGYFNISTRKINAWINDAKGELVSSSAIGTTLATVGAVLATVLLTPVYIFMFLYYQPLLLTFLHKLFGNENDNQVGEILLQSKSIIQSYLVGLFAEFAIIAILNTAGLLILGIDYALLLGIAGALLNVIPYLGGVIAVFLFMTIALVTKPAVYVLYVAMLYSFIQFIDNTFLVPAIVGSKVKLNALISIIAVFAGAALWGVPGMFLSIPLTAILKVIFDHIGPLKPWGFLLGNIVPTTKPKFNFIKKKAVVKVPADTP